MILTAGLTPAWQQVLLFDTFTPGEVNRARQVYWCASGKVFNAARALHSLGGPGKALAPVGGSPGQDIRRDLEGVDIAARLLETSRPTRVCTTILDSIRHTATELVPETEPLSAEELEAFRAAYTEEAKTAEVVVLIGSLPPGTPVGFYRDLLAHTPGRAILDARGAELLQALQGKPFLIKPNRAEVSRTFGRELEDDQSLQDAMRQLNEAGAEWVVVTDGPKPVFASTRGQLYRLQAPQREVVNPIGCGDCMAAGIAQALFAGQSPLDAIRFGVAAAAAKVGQLLPGQLELAELDALVQAVVISHSS
jgi:1-phosphofructokinase family hexose kinase